MKKLCSFLLLISYISADNLDMFDIVDDDANSSQNISESHRDIRMKLSHLLQNYSHNETVMYVNISENSKHYVFDVRVEANEDVQSLHVKDLYYKTSYAQKYFCELGRMNVKEGIAYGYNPTDYFKGGSSFTLSVDPKERKENRLGAVLFQASAILDAMTIKALYAPKISTNKSIWGNKKYIGLHLDESNDQDRYSLYVGYTGFEDLSISGILHRNVEGNQLGLNLSYIQDKSIWYMEASLLHKKSNMSTEVASLGFSEIKDVFSSKEEYRSELSLGINYTSDNNIVSTFEYIYNDAGMDTSDWKSYFSLANNNSQYAGLLAQTRGNLSQKSMMMSKHTLFVMARQSDVLTNLDWSALAWVNLVDKSSLVQLGISYEYDDILLSLDTRAYLGNSHTEYGSYANNYEALLSMSYYF